MNQDKKQNNSMRTIILFVVAVPVIIWLVMFAQTKSSQSAIKARECQDKCIAKGYEGYEFQWQVLSGPQCSCVGTQSLPGSGQ